MSPPSRSRGFTLLELLVVMVIIGLLASFVAPRYFDQVGKSESKAARAQLVALGAALASYRLDTGQFPATELGLQALVEAPTGEAKWSGPYLSKAVPADPWGHFSKPPSHREPMIRHDAPHDHAAHQALRLLAPSAIG
jgi:general secretion pathway protein G